MSLALLLLASALADPGHRVTDSADIWRMPPDTSPPVGTWMAVATPGLRPCAQPAPPCAGDPLPVGADLVLVESRDEVYDGQHTLWHRVARAKMADGFGTADGPPLGWVRDRGLTQAAFTTDLSGDGSPEQVVVRFTDDLQVEAWVARPGAGLDPTTVARLDLGQRRDVDGPQDLASVTLVDAAVAGIPLVRVTWTAREMCGSGDSSAYLSYRAADGAPPAPRVALTHNGGGGDAPIWWDTEIRFDPTARTAQIRSRAGESGDDGSENVHHDETKLFRLQGGVFVEHPTNP